MEYAVLDDFGVKLRNAVYRAACRTAEVSHLYTVVKNDGHSCYLLAVAACYFHKMSAITVVYLNYNSVDSGEYSLHKIDIPRFKRFCHNRMVCIIECICNDVPRLIPVITAVIEQYSHKLGDSEGGMGIVYVDSYLFVKVFKSTVNVHVTHYNIAYRSGAHKILLTQTKSLTLKVIIVGVKYLCQ